MNKSQPDKQLLTSPSWQNRLKSVYDKVGCSNGIEFVVMVLAGEDLNAERTQVC